MSPNKFVLLIDDDAIINFVHQKVIQKSALADRVETLLNGKEAIEFLKNNATADSAFPSLILLDINMPVMDGWEFLDEYKRMQQFANFRTKIVVLTTSVNPDDKEKAEQNELVTAFKSKPLTEELLQSFLNEE